MKLTYFEWLDILILFNETCVQILVWGDMRAENLDNRVIYYLCAQANLISNLKYNIMFAECVLAWL